jgi:cyclase
MRSRHFNGVELAEGVYAAIASENGAGVGNAGVIDLGGLTLILDTFLTPQAGQDLRKWAEELTGRAPDLVVNTHYHNDHVWGNQVFLPEAKIISSIRTRQLMQTAGVEELHEYTAISPGRYQELKEQYEREPDPEKQKNLLFWMAYYEGLVEALPALHLCLPSITFERNLTLHGELRTAELLSFDAGHTGGDTVLYLPDSKTAFLADLLFVGCHPYLADGDPDALQSVLVTLQELDAHTLIPGHGPPGKPADLQLMIDYIELCRVKAREISSDIEVEHLQPPSEYADWLLPHFFNRNVSFLRARND